MANRILVGLKEGIRDARGERVKRQIKEHLGIRLDRVRTIDVYTVDSELTAKELEDAAAGPFSDPVIQEYAIDKPLATGFDVLIEVGFRPGVTDNTGRTAREANCVLLASVTPVVVMMVITPTVACDLLAWVVGGDLHHLFSRLADLVDLCNGRGRHQHQARQSDRREVWRGNRFHLASLADYCPGG